MIIAMIKTLTSRRIMALGCIAPISTTFIFLFSVFLCQLYFIGSDKIEASDGGIENPSPLKKKATYVEGEILVKFKENVIQEDVEAINKGFNTTIIKKVKNRNLYLIKIPEGESIENMIKKYNLKPEVEYSQPNNIYRTDERR